MTVKVVAYADIPKGHLAIPVFCRRDLSFIIPHEAMKNNRSPIEVIGKVKWEETGTGIRPRTVEHFIYCQPERRIPVQTCRTKAVDYNDNTDCHPFWHIRRSFIKSEVNCDVVHVDIVNITNSGMVQSAEALTAEEKKLFTPTTAMTNITVSIPFIVNTAKIEVGKELVVYMEKKPEEKKSAAKRKIVTPFTQESSSSSKSHKTK